MEQKKRLFKYSQFWTALLHTRWIKNWKWNWYMLHKAPEFLTGFLRHVLKKWCNRKCWFFRLFFWGGFQWTLQTKPLCLKQNWPCSGRTEAFLGVSNCPCHHSPQQYVIPSPNYQIWSYSYVGCSCLSKDSSRISVPRGLKTFWIHHWFLYVSMVIELLSTSLYLLLLTNGIN